MHVCIHVIVPYVNVYVQTRVHMNKDKHKIIWFFMYPSVYVSISMYV